MSWIGRLCLIVCLGLVSPALRAAEENKLPPVGIKLPAEDAARLSAEVNKLKTRIAKWRDTAPAAGALARLPDIEIFLKAVDYAVRGEELYQPREIAWADEQLRMADERLTALERDEAPWTREHGTIVRGFRSALDDSPQPYGVVIPNDVDLAQPAPLYVWLHGRGDKALDIQFIHARMRDAGQIRPAGAIVVHPFGRYCNGYKSAGEIDVLEAVAAACDQYQIDRDRIVLCGFSMGGAGVWHLGAHYPDRWAAMSPGAGFVDVRRYQGLTPDKLPPWYEQAMWNVYDVPEYARNLLNVPLVAYSGELDKQKQSADIMEAALAAEGLKMTHIVGPGVAHKYEPAALADVLARLRGFAEKGVDHHPAAIHLQTRTLRYNRCHWLTALGLEEHWRDSRIDAERAENGVTITTRNITCFRLDTPWPAAPAEAKRVTIDGQALQVAPEAWRRGAVFVRTGGNWKLSSGDEAQVAPAKTPGLQGPIDDAFVEPFLIVRPTGKSANPAVAAWVAAEQARFAERWRTLFRGEPREIDDRDVTPELMAKFNLLLWGDPTSNQVLAKVAGKLPITWDNRTIRAGDHSWPADKHALAMIYPNPLAAGQGRYIVINSGVTFREAHDRTNSLQNPKLADWGVFDLSQKPDNERAGRIADAGFFDEAWQYQAKRKIGAK